MEIFSLIYSWRGKAQNSCPSRSDDQESTSILGRCGRNEEKGLIPVTEQVHLGLGKEPRKKDCLKITTSSFACQTGNGLPESAVIETEEICEAVLGFKDSCLGSGGKGNTNSPIVNVSGSEAMVNSTSNVLIISNRTISDYDPCAA